MTLNIIEITEVLRCYKDNRSYKIVLSMLNREYKVNNRGCLGLDQCQIANKDPLRTQNQPKI